MVQALKISKRLATIALYLPNGTFFADIGTDHAYLPCYVCLNDPLARVIAGEANEGPYQSALHTVKTYQLHDVIDVRLGDGLEVIMSNEHIKQIVIAGMGGSLITQILDKGKRKLHSVERIIVQPNVNARLIRQWMLDHHFSIVSEEIIEEHNHIYEIIVADQGKASPYKEDVIDQQLLFGPFLMKEKSQPFIKKWKSEMRKITKIIQQMEKANVQNKQLDQFKLERKWMKEVIKNE